MDDARAVINLKEGTIELQGPVDFVRHYLDTYRSAIRGSQGLPRGVAAAPGMEEAPSRRRGRGRPSTRARKAKRGSSLAAVRRQLKTGFFDESRSMNDLRQRLNEAGLACTDRAIRAGLRKLSETGKLEKAGRGRAMRYRRLV
ncbi:MAG: hypothetical protein Q8P00_00215 [Dehalococcoidia bacterium]|nr:hypothetical protein [Dehalococcoidia bacterium]